MTLNNIYQKNPTKTKQSKTCIIGTLGWAVNSEMFRDLRRKMSGCCAPQSFSSYWAFLAIQGFHPLLKSSSCCSAGSPISLFFHIGTLATCPGWTQPFPYNSWDWLNGTLLTFWGHGVTGANPVTLKRDSAIWKIMHGMLESSFQNHILVVFLLLKLVSMFKFSSYCPQ